MRLLRLRVAGLRSFTRETEIDLERLGELGLFAISGPTGAGKSSILDGIFLALFGRSPRGEASECVSAGALELAVRLTLAIDGDAGPRELAVERRYKWSKKRKADAGSVGADLRGAPRHQPLRIEERAGDAWAAVDLAGQKPDEYLETRILKISMADFKQAVVLPQGEFDALLHARPAERRTLVASLFRTEHLGGPLFEVLKRRETSVRAEMARLGEVEREVLVRDEDAALARDEARDLAARVQATAATLERLDREAIDKRIARQRCASRDESARELAEVAKALAAREGDRDRAVRGRRAVSAEGAAVALADAEREAEETITRAADAERAAHDAEVRQRGAARALGVAIEARIAELPSTLGQLGRAQKAEERAQDLAALEAARGASERARDEADEAAEREKRATTTAKTRMEAADEEARVAAGKLEASRVREDERAEAIAAAAVAELADAEERLAGVAAAEIASAEEAVRDRDRALVTAESAAREADAEATRARAEAERLAIDAKRALEEADRADRAVVDARRAAAAADLASALRRGEGCPVCGSREHPGADHRAAATTIDLAERGASAARRLAQAAERAREAAEKSASAREEDGRARSADADAALVALGAAREALAKQRSGEIVPRAVAEARASCARLADRAEAALGGVAEARRDAVRERAIAAPKGEAEARITRLNRRAREAESLAQAHAAALDRAARLRDEHAKRTAALEIAIRARDAAQNDAQASAAAAGARHDEVRALLADLEPAGQRDLFGTLRAPRTASEWVRELSEKAAALTAREASASEAMEAARAETERRMLEAREASVRRGSARAELQRAERAASEAMRRAGFESLGALREAMMDPDLLDALERDLARLDQDHERLVAVLAARRRDAAIEVSEDEARTAETARDEARRDASSLRDRAVQAASRVDEIERKMARAKEIRARIDALSPRAQRLSSLRSVVQSNQLAERVAELHLLAVTRGAASLLRTLSSDRYALVRGEDGAFAVEDAAHGGLVRPPSTLSGGETFLVSLSLALSLSERIQLAGRTRFDFFFLDEGFGSLDPATLEIALTALEKLRGPKRVIGMISHVGVIEDRMPRRLKVSTERRGGPTAVVYEP